MGVAGALDLLVQIRPCLALRWVFLNSLWMPASAQYRTSPLRCNLQVLCSLVRALSKWYAAPAVSML